MYAQCDMGVDRWRPKGDSILRNALYSYLFNSEKYYGHTDHSRLLKTLRRSSSKLSVLGYKLPTIPNAKSLDINHLIGRSAQLDLNPVNIHHAGL